MPVTPQDRKRFKQLDREQSKYEAYWQPLIEQAINRQLAPFIASVREHGPGVALAHINELITPDAMREVLGKLWRAVGVEAANSEWGYLKGLYGAEMTGQKRFGFNSLWASIINLIFSNSGGERIVKITETERERVQAELRNAANDGKATNYELAEALESSDIGRRRSKVIARTETAYAASEGGEAAASRTGFMMQKTWLSVGDNRTRRLPEDSADHAVMNGIVVPMDDKFLVPSKRGLDLMSRPHDLTAPADQTIMCRCKAVYKALRDASGRLIRISLPFSPTI